MQLRGKRLLILGGSRISCEIIRHAREMGIVTGVTDWYAIERSPAKQLADEAYYVSTADIDAMAALVRDGRFDGIMTGFTDSVLPYYAELCERVGMPSYGTKEQFELFTNKERYKALLREYDVPTIPEYYVDPAHFNETSANIQYPVIVKPSDGSGSRGITVCYDQAQLQRAINFAEQSSKEKGVLVEEYIDNPEVTIFWLFVNGEYHVSLLGNRHIKHNQEGELPLPAGYTYPSSVLPSFMEKTAPKMKNMFRSIGIRDGMMFMQCKVVNGVCVIYDIGYRLTGSLEYINLNRMCGYDPLDMMIHFALTGDAGEPRIAEKIDPYLGGRYSYNVSLLCKPGKIAAICGLDEIKKLPGVIDAVVAHPEGDIITPLMKGRLAQITVRILGEADSIMQMRDEMLKIQLLAHVVSETGEEMILPGLEKCDFEGTIYEGN